ncbi:MAG: GAF domain-containing protein [Anaerolineae bacterium]|jgi:GAF domain-containing protein|nr:GAF domain-containing protein [Anaerolineae bacterium]
MQNSRQLPLGLGLRYTYSNAFERQRAISLLYLMLIVGIGTIALLVVNVASAVSNRIAFQPRDYMPIGLLFFAIVVTYLIQNGKLVWGARAVVVVSFVALIIVQEASSVLTWATVNALVIIGAGLLLNRLSFIIVSGLLVLNLIRVPVSDGLSFADALAQGYGTAFILMIIMFIFLLLFSILFEESIRREVEGSEQLSTVGHFLRFISRKDEEQAFASVIQFVRKDLRYNFSQIFLVDDDSGLLAARIRSGIGVDAEIIKTDVRVSDSSALTQALRTKTPIFVTNRESEFRRDHFLPSTKFGVALPVIVRDDVVAILDVQDAFGRFSRMRMRSLELLAEGLSIVLENTMTVNALRLVLNDQSATLENLRHQLREYKQYEKQVVGGVWDEYLQGRGYEAIGFDLNKSEAGASNITASFDLPDDLAETLEKREVHVELGAEGNLVYVPILLRGEVLGALRFVLPANSPPSERQIDLIQNVVDRLALALENKRLFEQSRTQALRERKANEVVRELIGATEVRDVLSLAAQMFNDALGAIHTHIQLQPDAMKLQSTLTSEVPPVSSDTTMGDSTHA